MNIAVNTQLLIKDRLEGIGWFAFETLRRMVTAHPEHRFFFIFDRAWDPSFVFADNVVPLRTTLPSRHPVLWYARFHHVIPRLLKKHAIDLFYSPDGFSIPGTFPSVVALHDLNFMHFPENLPPLTRAYYRRFFPAHARNARRIITVSEFSRQDIARSCGIDPDRIDVVYNGAGEAFRPLTPGEVSRVRRDHAEGKPYFLFVGALNPRKNLQRLIQAFGKFCRQDDSGIRLLIVGEAMFGKSFYNPAVSDPGCRERIRFTGRLGREELARVMGGALALVLPSTFEGFGIPIVEAMACDVPVITSHVSAMPEVAGDAALLTDPWSVESMAADLHRMAYDPELRARLVARGRRQRMRFSWDATARAVWNTLDKSLH
jgi:glycosyltransferase involved in cell wall biosynthesis